MIRKFDEKFEKVETLELLEETNGWGRVGRAEEIFEKNGRLYRAYPAYFGEKPHPCYVDMVPYLEDELMRAEEEVVSQWIKNV